MNQDILKGSLLEIKGRAKEQWGRLTDNDPCELEGKCEKLLGLLRKEHGYIRDKVEPEYQDTVKLAKIVSRIREIRIEKKDVVAIAFIARYGKPLLSKNQESKLEGDKKKTRYYNDRYFNSRLPRSTAHLASR